MNTKAILLKKEISQCEVLVSLYTLQLKEQMYLYYQNKKDWYSISVVLDEILKNLYFEENRLKDLKKQFVIKFN